ncbi:hypothetical protein CROQUDRAFT_672706 [Cronartium quercuum f. sp. fusiforme G11]|uniref:Uncharacterized protein n=1 Tax=Cronartium quercuum f. sp. fusiforme G11 TaxID=708437 RepID=A0A9P6T978_9BASI|nr:hypothetical protein CROQUDRAFT_672706 [Cronartium quercuum f. sp. fusiforme G11]
MCYNYFMESQGCVSAANAHRCDGLNKTAGEVQVSAQAVITDQPSTHESSKSSGDVKTGGFAF